MKPQIIADEHGLNLFDLCLTVKICGFIFL
jgi:hypothetical protein